jgi:hypothetical protein
MQVMRSAAIGVSSELMSDILNCVCPDCGGSMGCAGRAFKCLGKSAGLARNLGASPVRWFRQTIDKGDQSELISEERIHIKQTLPLVLVISASVLLAQDNNAPKGPSQNNTKPATEQTVVTGCVSRLNGDFVLVEQDPAMTYELHSTGKIKVGHYLGQQVEVAGKQSPSLTTSSDSLEGRAPSSVTLTISSIKTIAKECTEQLVSN